MIRALFSFVLFAAAFAGCGGPGNVQAPIGGSPPSEHPAPLGTPSFAAVARSAHGMSLYGIDGAVFVVATGKLARVGPRGLDLIPPPQGKEKWSIYAITGRWPDAAYLAWFTQPRCRGSSIEFYKWTGSAWTQSGGGAIGYTAASLDWQMRTPRPVVPGCGTAYSAAANERNAWFLAKLGCSSEYQWFLFPPNRAEGDVLPWASPRSDNLWLVGGTTDEVYVAVHGSGDTKTKLMRFDVRDRAWTEATVPIGTTAARLGAASVSARGTLWAIARDEGSDAPDALYRRARGGAWEAVDLGGGLVPRNVVARDDDDVWVVATPPGGREAEQDATLLHTGPAPAALVDFDH